MYLKTPKRYTRRGQRRPLFSLKRVGLWLVTLLLIFVGVGIYENRASIFPVVQSKIDEVVTNISGHVATMTAPTPTPTPDPAGRLEQANNLWKQGSLEQALDIYQEILPAMPNDVTVHYNVTLGLIVEGHFEDALAAAESTVTANPFASDAWAIRAWALEWNGKYGESIASSLQALDIDPKNARAMAFLAEAYLDVNQNDRALETVNKALDLNPNSFEAYRVRGRIVQEAQFDLQAAKKDYQKAYDLAPTLVLPAVDLALIDYSLGDYQSGIDILRDALDLNPQNTQVLYNLGLLYFRGAGDYNRASDILNRCVEADPKSIRCYYILGRSQIGLEDYDAAAQSFQKTIELGTTDPFHYWWAARAFISQGNCPSAIEYLRTGYDLAQKRGDTSLISDYEAIASECQMILGTGSTPEVTPTVAAKP